MKIKKLTDILLVLEKSLMDYAEAYDRSGHNETIIKNSMRHLLGVGLTERIFQVSEKDADCHRVDLAAQYDSISGLVIPNDTMRKSVKTLTTILNPTSSLYDVGGLNQNVFLSFYLYSMIELYFDIKKGKISAQNLPVINSVIAGSAPSLPNLLTLLESEIWLAVNAYCIKDQYEKILKNPEAVASELDSFIKELVSSLTEIPNHYELCFPCGFKGHAIYIGLSRINNNIIVHVDNLGAGTNLVLYKQDKFIPNREKNGRVTISTNWVFDLANQDDMSALENYLKSICLAKTMDESQAIPVIYNFDNQFNFSTEREKIDYPDFEKQKSDNCPIENFKVGMKIRSWWSGSKGNESLIYDWLIGQQKIAIHHAPYDKKPFEELCFFRHLSESHISSTDTDKYSKEDRLKQGDWSKNKFPKPPTNFIDRKGLCDFYSKMTLFNTESIEELVFSGPSGVGKTTIATELAHTLKAKCDHIVYLDASHGLLDALRLTAKKSNCISEDKLHSDDSLISEFSMFLANSGKVLLFVDNLNDSQDKEKLGDLLPTTFKKDSAMLTIITSQITDWSDWHTTNFKQELIGLYEPQEIIAYLDKRHLTLSESEIEKLTRVTCSHPYVCRLVLDHIKDSKISIKNYLEKYDNKLIKSAESALNIVWKNIVSTFINSQELEALHLLKQLVFVDKENITQEFIKSFMSITDEEAAQFITILCSNKSLLTEKLDGIFSIHSMLSDLIEGMVEDSLSVRKELLMKFSIFSKNIIGKEWTVDFWKHAFFIVKSLSLTELDGDLNNTANYVRLLYKLAKTAVRFNGYDAILEQRLVEILEKHSSLGENNPELINKVLTALSWLASDKSDYVKAQNYAEQSLALCKEKFAENRSITADAYDLLASTYWEIAQLEKREDNLKQALDLHTISLSMRQSDDPYLLHTLNGLGIVCTDLGGDTNLKLALKYHTEALNMRQAPSVYPIDLAASYNNVACVNYKLGKIAISRKDKLAKLLEAENGHEKARKIRVSTIFESDSYRHLGRVYFWRSKLESTDEGKLNFLKKAEDCHHKSLTMRQDNLSKESPLLAAAYKQFARVCYEIALIEKNVSKKYEGLKKSLFYHEEALKIRKVALPNHRNTANSYYYLSEVLFRLVKEYHKDRRENLDKAKKYIVQAERIMITSKRDLDDTKKIAKLKKEIHSYHGNPPPVLPPLSPIGINGSNLGSISNKSGSFSATRPSSHDKSTSSNSSASLPSSKMPNALVMGEGGRIVHHLVAPVMMEEQVARHLIPNRTTRLRVFDQLPTETKKLAVTGQFFLANANTLSRQKREIVPVSSIKRKSPTSDATFFRTTPKREEVNIQTIHMMIKKT